MVAEEIQSFDKEQLRPKKNQATEELSDIQNSNSNISPEEKPVLMEPEKAEYENFEEPENAVDSEPVDAKPLETLVQPSNTEPVVLENLIIAEEVKGTSKTEPDAPKHGG